MNVKINPWNTTIIWHHFLDEYLLMTFLGEEGEFQLCMQIMNRQLRKKVADKRRSDRYVVFMMILCGINFFIG